eukprot:m.134144 g.134144  ORF g.134144 m.134144 type:complete len:163 (-) comp17554_c0_seq1:134-622(-)
MACATTFKRTLRNWNSVRTGLASYSHINVTAPVAFRQSRCLQTTGGLKAGAIPVTVTFVNTAGDRINCKARVGENLLDVAVDNNIDLEGACGGTLSCSTCHVYVDETSLSKLPKVEEEEEDMLDLAIGLRDNSRLGCQCFLTEELDGIEATLPDEQSDARIM